MYSGTKKKQCFFPLPIWAFTWIIKTSELPLAVTTDTTSMNTSVGPKRSSESTYNRQEISLKHIDGVAERCLVWPSLLTSGIFQDAWIRRILHLPRKPLSAVSFAHKEYNLEPGYLVDIIQN